MTTLLRISPVADELGELFRRAGHELHLVGGSVRDALLGRLGNDLDFTTDARPDRILELVRPWADAVWETGVEFGTVGATRSGWRIEVTTFRADQYDGESRNPEVTFGESLADDLLRRDFAVNAMAVSVPDHRFTDPFGGLQQLAERLLDTPGRPEDSFHDDPLRMMRAARFTSQLGFRVADRVTEAMTAMAGEIRRITVERISAELSGLLLGAHPRAGLELLTRTGLAAHVLPELPALILERDEHHQHKDVYQHSLTVLEQAIALEDPVPAGPLGGSAAGTITDPPSSPHRTAGLENPAGTDGSKRSDGTDGTDGTVPGPDLVLRLAALLHDIGKPATRRFEPGGGVSFHHHEVVGARLVKQRLRELRFPAHVVKDVEQLTFLHLRFHGYSGGAWTDSAVRRYVHDAGPLLPRLNKLVRADCTTRNPRRRQALQRSYDDLEARIAALAADEDLRRVRPDLDGNEIMRLLGIPPGPMVGRAWAHLKDVRLERGPLDRVEAEAELFRWAREQGLLPEQPREQGLLPE
ncbi:HDIG domain-containing metalloprotein [Nakamurella endophytica]|uniref:HDIG domain-containing metalloprotein n=1 Tax=Nakamurella endophytica TaxID=1748367 RepID=UPI001E2B85C5|nr:HDIG domain-containing metalloprotein [Nakamurella endophytica]